MDIRGVDWWSIFLHGLSEDIFSLIDSKRKVQNECLDLLCTFLLFSVII